MQHISKLKTAQNMAASFEQSRNQILSGPRRRLQYGIEALAVGAGKASYLNGTEINFTSWTLVLWITKTGVLLKYVNSIYYRRGKSVIICQHVLPRRNTTLDIMNKV